MRLVDRPLLIPPGTTQADPSFQLQTGIDDHVDSGGIERHRRVTAWGIDLSARSAAGPVEIGIGIGSRIRLEGAVGLLDGDKAGDLTLDAGLESLLSSWERGCLSTRRRKKTTTSRKKETFSTAMGSRPSSGRSRNVCAS